jgi:hypothetical protein
MIKNYDKQELMQSYKAAIITVVVCVSLKLISVMIWP